MYNSYITIEQAAGFMLVFGIVGFVSPRLANFILIIVGIVLLLGSHKGL